MSLRERFLAFDDELAAHGVLPLTAWWRAGIGAWLDAYEQRQVLELWGCVGRGAAKSTALYKLAAFFALFGDDFKVPPGEVHFAIVLSRMKEEASKGIDIIDRWLNLLGIEHRLAGDVIELVDVPRGIRVVSASVAATSGFRATAIFKDERSKWSAQGAVELDAEEIDTSASAMTATHPNAPIVAFGSAWAMSGSFYEAIVGGSNDSRIVLGPTPTWIAAPHVTEESTRKKEKNPRRWAREYACQFQAGAMSAFDPDEVDAAFKPRELVAVSAPVLVLDPTSGRGDTWAFGLARWAIDPTNEADQWLYEARFDPVTQQAVKGRLLRDANGCHLLNPDYVPPEQREPVLSFSDLGGFEGTFAAHVSAESLVARLATFAKRAGVSQVISDQREAYLLASAFERHGLRFRSFDWTSSSKPEAFLHLTRLLRERRIHFEPHEQMRADLLGIEERVMPSGALTFSSRRTGSGHHSDFAALPVTACLLDLSGDFRGSPVQARSGAKRVTSRHIGPI